MEKLTSTKKINISLHQGNDFINLYKLMYKNFFRNYYARWLKGILPLSIWGAPVTDSTYSQW